ncbi:UPF0434 protein Mmar10_2939-like [Corticium candelabrum]|uniref:UPF0434 protein Mmar10_2939-like n=1 Tax=Corticium candelabrum TaxID=121492 RepID=UPI002E26B454|nr:UPF0434 protein Mmar10_2939-like [Corticium candelabrum]
MAGRILLRRLHLAVTRLCSERSIKFNEELLQILACPLSKKPLRYDEKTNELVSDEIGVAYPIRDGIPCLLPQEGRRIKREHEKLTEATDN